MQSCCRVLHHFFHTHTIHRHSRLPGRPSRTPRLRLTLHPFIFTSLASYWVSLWFLTFSNLLLCTFDEHFCIYGQGIWHLLHPPPKPSWMQIHHHTGGPENIWDLQMQISEKWGFSKGDMDFRVWPPHWGSLNSFLLDTSVVLGHHNPLVIWIYQCLPFDKKRPGKRDKFKCQTSCMSKVHPLMPKNMFLKWNEISYKIVENSDENFVKHDNIGFFDSLLCWCTLYRRDDLRKVETK